MRSVDVVIDNPPYTGAGMKERVLSALVGSGLPFCLLLPLGAGTYNHSLPRPHLGRSVPDPTYIIPLYMSALQHY